MKIYGHQHRKKSQYTWRKYDYDYKAKSNLFNLDSLYRKCQKSFIKSRKQEFEILFMYYWIHDMEVMRLLAGVFKKVLADSEKPFI